MSQVIEHLAEITGYRDRDALDVTLVTTLMELLQPQAVGVYRVVGGAGAGSASSAAPGSTVPGESRRWLTRAVQHAGEAVAGVDPLWAEFDTLPPLDAHPLRAMCLQHGEPGEDPGPPVLTVFPLAHAGDGAGVLEITSSEPLGADALRLVGGILRVLRNFQTVLDDSERDTLTGLLNRKTFENSFLRSSAAVAQSEPGAAAGLHSPERRAEVAAAGAPPTRFWVGVIDIDHFKRVNDQHGHLIGDEVLLLLSRLMRQCFRWHDQLYRFGGEEFVVLLRAPRVEDAARALERLREKVQAYVFPQAGPLTVSLGFTEVRASDTPTAAFERADKAVYYAKQHGRNQVADFAALVAAGRLSDQRPEGDVELF
jgi:diguanylate cyclase (GGDEF)-like protein